ncbi:MAG: coproporphyrinogen-III oxidase family protein [Planctomycetota bacterium]
MRIDFLRLRHRAPARIARRMLYASLVGRGEWPPVFRAPNGDAHPLKSPHLYVHLPFCRRICPHCPYNKAPYDAEAHHAYGRSLLSEVEAYCRSSPPSVETLYFGGGTPTQTPDLIEAVLQALRSRLAPEAEVAVEVHPADADGPMLRRLREAGVNRISLGVECLDRALLRRLGRAYSPREAEASLQRARDAGFGCVDANLIYGIPGQDSRAPARDARRCIAREVDQISAYPLFSFQHTGNGTERPVDDRDRLQAQRAVSAVCREAGLERTSVWSFTRPGVAPYSTVTREDYVGFGAGAGSKVGGVFRFNTFSVDAYSRCRTHKPALVMRTSDRFRRFHWLYWQIYRARIEPLRYRDLFGRELGSDFALLLAALRLVRFVRPDGDALALTERGAIWAHRLQCLYSLTFIDQLWERCRREAWPQKVLLS